MNFTDVYYQPGDEAAFCYRSGLAVYEETFGQGMLCPAGWNAAGYPLNVLTKGCSRFDRRAFQDPSAFHVELDGRSVDYDLRLVDFQKEKTGSGFHAVLTLESSVKPILLKIHTLLDGSQMFTRYIEIENRSAQPMALNRLAILSGGVEIMNRDRISEELDRSRLYPVGYFDNDEWGREGAFVWRPMPHNTLSVDSRFGRDRFRHPLLMLRNNVTGTLWFYQIGWSGGCRFSADLKAPAKRIGSELSFFAEITGFSPLTMLLPGETFRTPEVHMGVVHGGLDDAVREMHAHIRRSVCREPAPCLVGAGMGAEHDMSVETTKSFMRQMAQMGAELFIIDAGWQNPPGEEMDWGGHNGHNVPDADRYPNGLAEVSDYCRSLGMKFGLWVEIERLGRHAKLYETHKDWFAKNIYGDPDEGYLDFTNPEAAAWAESELARIITEYKLDLLRVDYNVSHRSYFSMRDIGGGARECISLRHFAAVYKMYEGLKKRFPEVTFENCAGGGGRTDLGMMRAFNHTWVSDWQKLPYSVRITDGMTVALPPERVDRLFAGMGCHEFGSLAAHMRNTMLTHMSLNVIAPASAVPNAEQMEFVRRSVALYKSFIRPFLAEARVFHHTPDIDEAMREGFSALEIASPDAERAALAVFSLTEMKKDRVTVYPCGLSAGFDYTVTLDNSGARFVKSGCELMNDGISLRIPAALGSELVLFDKY